MLFLYILWEDVSWISLQNSVFEIVINFLVASSPFFNRRSLYSCEKNNWCLRKKNSWAQNIHFYVSDVIFLKEESYWLLRKIVVGHLKSTYRPHEFFLQSNTFFTKTKFSLNIILSLRLRCFRAILELSWRKARNIFFLTQQCTYFVNYPNYVFFPTISLLFSYIC